MTDVTIPRGCPEHPEAPTTALGESGLGLVSDPARRLLWCPACGPFGPVDAATYARALRADAQYTREFGDPEFARKLDRWADSLLDARDQLKLL